MVIIIFFLLGLASEFIAWIERDDVRKEIELDWFEDRLS